KDPHVETWTVMADQQRWQFGLAQPQAHPVAGHPRLGDLELGLADAVPVADAHLVIRETIDGEGLPERAVTDVMAAEISLPVLVCPDLVAQPGPLPTAVPGQVALAVTVDIEPAYHRRAVHWVLPYPRVDGLALPGHVLRQAHVDRHQHR